ncbi:hypothetical protein BKA67DRAFT_158152 [Truncatella angustata]|uniref:Uncharacterized protein n=1 Tax=Truncatella angustata TaxID=152316 RepID=A0A9P8ZZX9_9PEZI|nr:uncharacterized protein BKA67DRAFT_158152 [Truncatella angustata]KAH6656494.1 hypothetical protein BKA67DRAFT_158152 [Truncatella angustata]
METASIAEKVRHCLEGFKAIANAGQVSEELARFKVWTGNIGAHRKGSSSLDYRLRDASHLRIQVISVLSDLIEALSDAASILRGEQTPWDELPEYNDELQETNPPSVLGENDVEFESELSQIYADITEVVDCLYRMSVSIQNPAPYNRFELADKIIDASVFEAADTAHVQQKFPGISREVALRLGRANSRRRQYFRYRESHHEKLSQGLEFDSNRTEAGGPSTIASSIPKLMKDPTTVIEFEEMDEDAQSVGGLT